MALYIFKFLTVLIFLTALIDTDLYFTVFFDFSRINSTKQDNLKNLLMDGACSCLLYLTISYPSVDFLAHGSHTL